VRFSDVANFPSGAAIGVIMFVLAALVVTATTQLVRRLTPAEARS
jgi:ABC-type spermidine/putrescine transport system permease subunit I